MKVTHSYAPFSFELCKPRIRGLKAQAPCLHFRIDLRVGFQEASPLSLEQMMNVAMMKYESLDYVFHFITCDPSTFDAMTSSASAMPMK